MPPILKPIGFDVPNVNPVPPTVPKQLPQPDTTGLQVLAQAGNRLDQSIQLSNQSQQVRAQSVAQVAQAANQSAQSVAQSQAQVAQLEASRAQQSANAIGSVGDTILRFVNQYAENKQKQDAAALKQFQSAQKAGAVQELERLKVAWVEGGLLQKNGSSAYFDAVAGIMGKYQLDGDTTAELTQQYAQPAYDFAKTTESNRQETAKDIKQQQRRVASGGLQAKLSINFGTLATATNPKDLEDGWNQLSKTLSDFMKDESIPLGDRLFAAGTALEVGLEKFQKGSENYMRTNKLRQSFSALTEYNIQQMQLLNSGQISATQYTANIRLKAHDLGIPDYAPLDPNADSKQTETVLRTNRSIQDLREQNEIDAAEASEANNDVISALAITMVLNPASMASIRGKKPELRDANEKEGLRLAEEFLQYRDKERPQLDREIAKAQADAENYGADFNMWFANASRQARDGKPQNLEQLRGLPPEVISKLTSGATLTNEDVNLVREVYTTRQKTAIDRRDLLINQRYNRDQTYKRYGLSVDVKETQGNFDRLTPKLEQWNDRRRQSIQRSNQLPGQNPNFSGGTPGKPLNRKQFARGQYAGQTITFPFDASVVASIPPAFGGQLYGADRKGRPGGHQGLDFAVPVGTPVLSLVPGTVQNVKTNHGGYGTSMEVVGDNGFIYFYAHLSGVKAKNGQRVGAGDVVALSGDTGAGSGAHLHMEVTQLKNGTHQFFNPLAHLAAHQFDGGAKQPRSSGNQRPSNMEAVLPEGAIGLGRNTFLYKGALHIIEYNGSNNAVARRADTVGRDAEITVKTVQPNYRANSPLRNSYAGGKTPTNIYANHGYRILADDREFAKAINTAAKELGIPGEWLADIMGHETAYTFAHDIDNDKGYWGLIQFGDSARRELGITLDDLLKAGRVGQVRLAVKYIRRQMGYAGITRIPNIATLASLIYEGNVNAKVVSEGGMPSDELSEYLTKLGIGVGRQYDHRGNRRNRVSSVIHTRPEHNCRTCMALLGQGDLTAFIPHESQEIA